jgi:hypothetical protein
LSKRIDCLPTLEPQADLPIWVSRVLLWNPFLQANSGLFSKACDLRSLLNIYRLANGTVPASTLLPKISDGGGLDYDLRHTRSDNFEFDYATYTFQGYATHVRTLAFVNHANLGNYSVANKAYLTGRDKTPDVTLYRHPGPVKPQSRPRADRRSRIPCPPGLLNFFASRQ